MAPPFCWTCQGLCVSERDRRHRVVGQRTRFYCSKECRWLDESNPGRYTGDRNYLDRYHGWEASEVIRDLGLRPRRRRDADRPAAPASDERRWTLSDIRAHDLKLRQPQHPRRPRAGAAQRRLVRRSALSDGAVPLELAAAIL